LLAPKGRHDDGHEAEQGEAPGSHVPGGAYWIPWQQCAGGVSQYDQSVTEDHQQGQYSRESVKVVDDVDAEWRGRSSEPRGQRKLDTQHGHGGKPHGHGNIAYRSQGAAVAASGFDGTASVLASIRLP
jgi:hypothetical protein